MSNRDRGEHPSATAGTQPKGIPQVKRLLTIATQASRLACLSGARKLLGNASLKENAYKARVAALSLVQMTSVVNLLRAHGETLHAEGVEAAKDAVITIIARQLGRDALAHAMKCVADEIGGDPQQYGAVTTQH